MYDLIVKNGLLKDAANGWAGQRADIAIEEGRIGRIAPCIEENASYTLDAGGRTVTPGLIDFHAHFFSGATNISLEFSSYLATGVTNAVDAGSSGPANVDSFFRILTEREKRNTRIFLNVASEGLSSQGAHPENINPNYFDRKKIRRLCERYVGTIVGLKIRISREIAQISNTTSFEALRPAVAIAEECGLPLSVHMPDFQGELSELIDILRPGDIFCHVLTPQKGIMEGNTVSKEILRGKEKGIIMESACGRGHMGHRPAMAAMKAGLYPDIISGDLTRGTFTRKPAVSLPYLISRFCAIGMPFEKVMECCTTVPAKMMGMEGKIGCLKEGAYANIAVFDEKEGRYRFTDVEGIEIEGNKMLCPAATVLEGELVYNNLPYAD